MNDQIPIAAPSTLELISVMVLTNQEPVSIENWSSIPSLPGSWLSAIIKKWLLDPVYVMTTCCSFFVDEAFPCKKCFVNTDKTFC